MALDEPNLLLREIQKEAAELFDKKNKDYGNAFAENGAIGVLVRIGDKISRLKNITKNKISLVEEEKLRDTLLDLHNYAAMAIMLLDDNEFEEVNNLTIIKNEVIETTLDLNDFSNQSSPLNLNVENNDQIENYKNNSCLIN